MNKINPQKLLIKAARHYKAGQIKEANKALGFIFKSDEWYMEGLLLIARVADQLGYYNISSKLLSSKTQDRVPNAFIYHQLGKYLTKKGDNDQAIKAQQKAIDISPKYLEAQYHLALILVSQRDFHTAIEACKAGLKQKALFSPIYIPYIRALTETKQFEEALELSNKLIKIKPNFSEAHFQKSGVLYSMGRLTDSAKACRQAITLNASDARVYRNLGHILMGLFELDEAEKMFQAAIKINPLEHVAHSNYLYLLCTRQQCKPEKLVSEFNKWDRIHCDESRKHQLSIIPNANYFDGKNDKKLKVGYVSYDFRNHAVAQFFEPLIKNHDNAVVETYCYANHSHHLTDTVTERLMSYADHWRSVGSLSDQAFAHQIQSDGIQVLVDLGGHTQGNRLKAFAFRPAPVQVAYLGFFGTTGLQEMDYWITDHILHPQDTKEFSQEKLYRLDRCWVSYQARAETVSLERINRNEEEIVFGSFSVTTKFSDEMLEAWCAILKALPKSRLVLLSKSYSEISVREKLLQIFIKGKIDPNRIQFKAQAPYSEYLKMYTEIDVVLDTFPRSGGTTTADALWMGVPVVTLAGSTYASRISASKLYSINRDDLVAYSIEEYTEKAVGLASNYQELEKNRSNYREAMLKSDLCDGKGLALRMEQAYQNMLRSHYLV